MNKKDLEEAITKIVEPNFEYNECTVRCTKHDKDLTILISQMYEFVDVTFDNLSKISELLQTRDINFGDKDCWPGCETCDYGSSYIITLTAKNVKLPLDF
jgi:hypothetical protein